MGPWVVGLGVLAAPAAPMEPAPAKPVASVAASGSAEGERAALRVALGGGTRAYVAHSVVSGDVVTGLSYTVDPILLGSARAVFAVPGVPLGLEGRIGMAPVRFRVASEPTPTELGGAVLDAAVGVWGRLELFGRDGAPRLGLTPRATVEHLSVQVDDDGERSVLLSWGTWAIGGGLRLSIEWDRSVVEVEGDVSGVVRVAESPTASGRDPSGVQTGLRLRGRTWPWRHVGFEVSAGYGMSSVAMVGPASRARFAGDPELLNASLLTELLDLGLAVVVAP